MVNQFDIYWIDLNPTIGSEINKIRPCIILSPIEMNNNLKTVIIAPITSTIKGYPFRINCLVKNKKGEVALDHIRSVDKNRLKGFIEKLDTETISKIKEIIKEMFVG